MAEPYVRPATPQAMVHRLPDKPDTSVEEVAKPAKFIILISASNEVAGKVQIAKSVAAALSCPLFQGDSLHETAARAARVGQPTRATRPDNEDDTLAVSAANEPRYQRMWLSKMTRTGLLFPEESRPAISGFSGFGGSSSTSSSRRGSASSTELSDDATGSVSSMASSVATPAAPAYINKPPMLLDAEATRLSQANAALMVLTHPALEAWHKRCIRQAISEYGIGVILVPLDEDHEPPILRRLDPRTMTSFTSFDEVRFAARTPAPRDWSEEVILAVDTEAKVEDIAEEIVDGVRDTMAA